MIFYFIIFFIFFTWRGRIVHLELATFFFCTRMFITWIYHIITNLMYGYTTHYIYIISCIIILIVTILLDGAWRFSNIRLKMIFLTEPLRTVLVDKGNPQLLHEDTIKEISLMCYCACMCKSYKRERSRTRRNLQITNLRSTHERCKLYIYI